MPDCIESLMDRRVHLIKNISNESSSFDSNYLNKIDKAYELIRSHLEQTYEPLRQFRDNLDVNVRANSLNSMNRTILAVSWCSHNNERWKKKMEDTRVFQDSFGNDSRKAYFAVFDGYGGQRAAHIAALELHHFLLHEMIKFDSSISCTCTANKASSATDHLNLSEQHKFCCRPLSSYSEIAKIHSISQHLVQQITEISEKNLHITRKEKKDVTYLPNKSSENLLYQGERLYNHRISESFKRAHQQTDLLLSLGKEESSMVRWSGCSTATIVIDCFEKPRSIKECSSEMNNLEQIGYMHIANCGKYLRDTI